MARGPLSPMARAASAGLAFFLCLGLACGTRPHPEGGERPDSPPARVEVTDGWLAMGTFFEVDLRVASRDAKLARDWLVRTRSEIARLEAIYSRHDPASELSALNAALATQPGGRRPVEGSAEANGRHGIAVGPELAGLLGRALSLARATGGAFDVSVGPLIVFWREAADHDRWPSREALERRVKGVGSDHLALVEQAGSHFLQAALPGMHLDLDGLSKGAVLDRLRDSLRRELPEAAALLSFGQSSLWAIGDPDGRGWRLDVRSRDPERGRLGRVSLRDQALSVSSSVGSVRRVAGRPVSHIIDPRSGLPVEGSVEAIVIAEEALVADAWSTALLVLAADENGIASGALARVEAAGLEAWLVGDSGVSRTTAGWQGVEARGTP
ncbi:MAG: FAD:protein FMN transferase [Deltaproteobacteria bacterium]|nr:FAD:protein FMN transferase [Deltaproteobacteria bacterium]